MKALLFAAGKGTRLKPFTDAHPKALVEVNGVSLLERNIKYLQSFGIQDFVINVHHFGEQIIEFIEKNEKFSANIEFSIESDALLETGGGLMFARKYLENEEDFLMMNADILTNLNIATLIKYHKENQNFVTLAVSARESSRKLLFTDELILKGWKNLTNGEKKVVENDSNLNAFAFSGIHCVSSKIFNKIRQKGKFSIMEAYLDLMFTQRICGFYHEADFIDVGKPEAVLVAEKLFK